MSDESMERLLAESSLGSPGARELISRSDPTEVSRVLQTARRLAAEACTHHWPCCPCPHKQHSA